ncbi:helix-turn-helix domain-containing protein [Saccharopolyspora spinosa]|uniref:Helix-turn-helix protein n=1 Tax=Saccharopolyspora spinosa TaxID=60894 RepID=A0A2N3XSJ7_SACSN|nr:helix-turn-helix transcriptional regulator [Saccharopolyspora spinosa]PKW13666.1 helix-turn-helix protein [Saccharopolyspora spinosa]
METFGQALRRLREDAGISQPQLARQAHISQSSLSRYEADRQAVDPAMAARLDELLGARGSLVDRHAPAALLGPDIDSDRLAYVARAPRAIDRAALESLGAVLASTRRLEDGIGVAPVLHPVRAYLGFMETLAAEARGSIRRDVVDQAGQWAQYNGWLNTALRSYQEACRWFSRSLEWAVEAEDDDLAATVWSFKGHVAWLRGEVGATIGLTRVARRYRDIYPGQIAYDALQEARGHAAIGDTYEVERLVEDAWDLAERALAELPGAPPWHYYRSPAFWELERGRALYQVRPQRAVEMLTTGLEDLPTDQQSADWAEAYRRDLAAAQALCA